MAAVLNLIPVPVGNASQVPPLRKSDEDGTIPTTLLVRLYNSVRDLIDRFNGRISMGTGNHGERMGNIDGQFINVQTPVTAHEEFEVPHGLGRVPVSVKIAYCEKPVIVYASGTGWTTTSVYLKCSESFLSADANAIMRLEVW